MRCKHNIIECIKDELFCIHCGMLIKKNESLIGDTICGRKPTHRHNVKTIMEAGVQERETTEKTTNHVCPRRVLDLFPGEERDNVVLEKCNMRQEVWIGVNPVTKEHDCEIHIKGKDIYEILDGISIIIDNIQRNNGMQYLGE